MKNKISVIIPIYNVEQYLSITLLSIVNQTHKNLEIICVDDCSTDSSLKIVEELAQKDNRIISIKNAKNSGAAITRNNGLKIATGEYIYFIDSDDFIEADYLEKMFEAIKTSGADIILNLNIINEFPDKSSLYVHPTFPKVNNSGEVIDRKSALVNTPWYIWARLYKKAFLDKNNLEFIDIKACNDFVFHYISHAYLDSMFVFFGSGYHYISRSDSITGVSKKQNNRDLFVIKAYNFIYDYFKKNNLLNKNDIKMFNVWPFFATDTEEKYNFYKMFFKKINAEHLNANSHLYNELELFFANSILSSKSFNDYKNTYGINVMMSFMRRKKNDRI